MFARTTAFGFLCTLFAGQALGQTAGMLGFQGLIKDAGGAPVTGTVDLEFRIYDAEALGNLVDMNGDGVRDGSDIQTFTDCLLGNLPSPADCSCAALGGISGMDSDDISLLVDAMINNPICPDQARAAGTAKP